MIGKYAFTIQPHYPHLNKIDVLIWESFIRGNPGFFDSVDYDVKIGKGSSFLPGTSEKYESDYQVLTQKKLDVVGYRNSEIWLIEVKPQAGSQALGQILTYEKLYKETFNPVYPVHKCVVTTFLKDEYDAVYHKFGVLIMEAGESPQTSGYREIP